MFFSLLQKGPRAVIAAEISKVLNEYFVVDQDAVESSLLHDARIVLRNTVLRTKQYRSLEAPNAVVSISGVVEEVVFSWQWSFLSSKDSFSNPKKNEGMVQDATLTINGIDMKVRVSSWECLNQDEKLLVESADEKVQEKLNKEEATAKKGFMENYIQQIVDNLTLKIHDFRFSIEVESGSSFNIHGDCVELNTISSGVVGKNEKTSQNMLTQEIKLCQLSFGIYDHAENLSYPVMEPFDYSASVLRLSGHRFQGGILSGLAITGHMKENTEVQFHLGNKQIRTFCDIGVLLAPPPTSTNDFDTQINNDGEDQNTHIEGDDSRVPTSFNFPLPYVTVNISGSTGTSSSSRITFPSMAVEYKADGSICKVYGTNGIYQNGKPLLILDDGATWNLDVMKKVFLVHNMQSKGGANVSKIILNENACKRLLSDVKDLMKVEATTSLLDSWDTHESVQEPTLNLDLEPWQLTIDGGTEVLIQCEENSKVIKAHIGFTECIFCSDSGNYKLSELKCSSLQISTSIDEKCSLSVSTIHLKDKSIVVIEDYATVTAASVQSVQTTANFLTRALESWNELLIDDKLVAPSKIDKNDLAYNLKVKGIKAHVEEEGMKALLVNIHGTTQKVCIETFMYKFPSKGHELQMKNIAVENQEQSQGMSTTVLIGNVERAKLPGLQITEWKDGACIEIKSNSISVALSAFNVVVQKSPKSSIAANKEIFTLHSSDISITLSKTQDKSSYEISHLNCNGVKIDTSLDEKFLIAIPAIHISKFRNFVIEDFITASVSSLPHLKNITEFVSQAVNNWSKFILGEEKDPVVETSGNKDNDFDYTIECAGIEGRALGEDITIRSSEIHACRNQVCLGSTKYCYPSKEHVVKTNDVTLKFDQCENIIMKVILGTLERVSVPGLSLNECRGSVSIDVGHESIAVYLPRLNLAIESGVTSNGEVIDEKMHLQLDSSPSSSNTASDAMQLPMPIFVNAPDLDFVIDQNLEVNVKLLLAKIYSEEGMLNVDTLESMSLKLSKSGEFIESLILPSFIALSDQSMLPSTFLFGGLNLTSTSFGLFDIKLPSMSSLPFTNHITASEEVCVTIEDTGTLNKLINSFSFYNEPSTKQVKDKAPNRIFENIPYTFEFPKIRLKIESASIEVDNALSTETSIRCGHTLILDNADNKRVKLQGIDISESLYQGILVEVEELNDLLLPGLIRLNEPCTDIKIQFHNDELIANVAGLRLNSLLGQDSESHSTKGSGSSPILSLPYQVKCNLINCQLLNFQSLSSVVVQTLAMSISQTGDLISLNVEEGATMIGIASDKNMIQGSFETINLKLPTDMSCFDLVECHCVSAALETVGDMYGGFRAAAPETSFTKSKMQIPGPINVSFEKLDSEVTSNLQQFLADMSSIFPSQSSSFEFPFPTYMNSFLVSASEPELNLKLETISAQKSSLVVNRVTGTIINTASCSLSTINCDLNSMETNIGSVTSIFLADNVALQQPVNNVRIIFNNQLAVYVENAVQLLLLQSQSTKSPTKQDSKEEELTLPFPIMLSLSKIILTPQGQETSSTLQDALLNVCPRQADLLSDSTDEVSIQLQLSEISNKLFQIHALKASFDTSLSNPDIIKKLKVAITKANVTAGFSTVDWVSLIKPKDNASNEDKNMTVYRTPHCIIDSIVLNLSYKGKVVSSKANVKLSPYQGDHNSTSDTIISHYMRQIQSRVPGFITNIKVLGADVLDASMTSVATVAAHTNLGVGSVAGVALADTIRAGIDSGKKARNADTNEGYKFGKVPSNKSDETNFYKTFSLSFALFIIGDLTRGSIRGIREAAKDGAKMRGGDPDTYVPGDFVAGTAKAVGSYTSNNKKKLTTAGGAGVASMVG